MSQGGSNMGPGGLNMGHGMGSGNNMGHGSPNMGHGGHSGHSMGQGPPSMGPGYSSPGMGHNGPPELTNRGRSLLGAPPGLDSPAPPSPSVPSGPPQPTPPATHQLEQQVATLKTTIKTLQEQIVQSESNLTAQWTVLQQSQRVQVEEAVHKAGEAKLEELSRSSNISLSILETVLQPIIESCTKDSISSGKSWIFQHATSPDSNSLISEYLAWRVTNKVNTFNQKLHLIYLMNDVLHHCVRKNASALKSALEDVAVPMYCSAAEVATDDEIGKLTKLITLWESKNKFFSDQTLDYMKNPRNSMKRYRSDLADEFNSSVEAVEKSISSTYGGYKQQHEQFVNHANTNMDQQQQQLEQLQQQIKEIEAKYEQELKSWQGSCHVPGIGGGGSGRRSRWDRTAPSHSSGPPPGLPVPDLSRPPPGFVPPRSGLGAGLGHSHSPKVDSDRPSVPYFDLPAGLMVPLVKLEDSGYKALDPALIRLPPPQPPNERLLAAVELFYSGPSHDRPRDPEGWEKLGLYEWSREKQASVKRKQDDIEDGVRSRSATPVDDMSRESTPEQTVPDRKEVEQEKEKKRYRSRSRTKSRSRTRSRTRSRSGSRGSTPPRRERSRRGRSRSRSRDRRENSRERGRGRDRSKSREKVRDKKRSRSREGKRKERSRSGSGGYSLPSYLTKRSPSPTVRVGFGDGGGGGGGQLDQSNKGHQMLQKMGWKGAGLGAGESGIVEPIQGGEVRDKGDQYKGMGTGSDPFESFRKQRAGAFYTRMKDKAEERRHKKGEEGEGEGECDY